MEKEIREQRIWERFCHYLDKIERDDIYEVADEDIHKALDEADYEVYRFEEELKALDKEHEEYSQ